MKRYTIYRVVKCLSFMKRRTISFSRHFIKCIKCVPGTISEILLLISEILEQSEMYINIQQKLCLSFQCLNELAAALCVNWGNWLTMNIISNTNNKTR